MPKTQYAWIYHTRRKKTHPVLNLYMLGRSVSAYTDLWRELVQNYHKCQQLVNTISKPESALMWPVSEISGSYKLSVTCSGCFFLQQEDAVNQTLVSDFILKFKSNTVMLVLHSLLISVVKI